MPPRPEQDDRSSDPDFISQVDAALRNRELIAYLAKWRSAHGPSQAETAKRMHTSQPAVARLESHQHDAQLSTLARYVSSLGLTLHFVLRDRNTGDRVWTSETGSHTERVTEHTTDEPVSTESGSGRAGLESAEESGTGTLPRATTTTESPFKSDSTPSNKCGFTLMNNQVGEIVAQVMATKPNVTVTWLPSMIRVDAIGRMDVIYDEISEAAGEEPGWFDVAEFEESMSTHYGRMIHEDDRTTMFANPGDAAEFIGFNLVTRN
jgi:propane monooxygenase coupling protein